MKELTVKMLWRAEKASNFNVKPHMHNYHELVYYISGEGETEVADRTYRFTAGKFITVPPYTLHSEHHFRDGEVICLGFLSEKKTDLAFYNDSSGEIYGILEYMLQEILTQAYGYNEILSARLTELSVKLCRYGNQIPRSGKSFKYIINYLKENHHEKISFPECAERLNLSYDYFRHRFKEITGLSPRDFLLGERLKASKKALENGCSCTQAAYMCGFSTSAQFSMLFKREFWISPKEYSKGVASCTE